MFLFGNLQLGQIQFALLAVMATLVGVAVITVPWWLKLVRDLGEERRERIVEAERAEIAAHLHDSVLQTLALIQRQSDQPREVLRLARGQERELRHWLYGPGGYGRRARSGRRGRPRRGGHGGRGARSRTPTRSTCDPSSSATPPRRRPARPRPRRPRGHGQRGQARRGGRDQRVRRGRGGRACTCSSATAASASTPTPCPTTGTASPTPCAPASTRHGGTVRLRSTPGEGTEVHLTHAASAAPAPGGDRR